MFRTLFLMIFLIFIGAMLLVGQSLYQQDLEDGVTRDIYNFTNNLVAPENTCGLVYNQNISIPEVKIQRLNNIVCSFSEFAVTSGIEVVKFGVEYGYENPQYDYNFFLKIFKIYIFAIILLAVFPVIVPLIALIYLLGLGVHKAIKYLSKLSQKTSSEEEKHGKH